MGVHNYSYALDIERDFRWKEKQQYFTDHWTDSLWYSVCYVIAIFSIQKWMQDRPKLELRYCLALWSLSLGIFSVIGFLRTFPELVSGFYTYGFQGSICRCDFFIGIPGFWGFLFAVSKLWELGDTLFIVLRKQNLIFLHWYHHLVTLIFVWYSYGYDQGYSFTSLVMNYGVHAIMYNYYALKALRFQIPKWVSMFITSLQIVQMILGLALMMASYDATNNNSSCKITKTGAVIGLLMYISYFVLFSHFFVKNYLSKSQAKTVKTKKKSD